MNDVPSGAWWTAAGVLFTAFSGWLLRAWELRHKQRQDDQKAEREQRERDDEQAGKKHDRTLEEYRQIVVELRAENARESAEKERAIDQRDAAYQKLGLCYQERSRMEERLLSHEEKLAAKNLPFRPWKPTGPDSAADIETQQ